MPFTQVNDTSMFYEEVGAGEPIVLVHGAMVEGTTWEFVVPRLAERFRVVTYDRRGHGRSIGPAQSGAIQVADLAELIDRLGVAPANLVGNSGGGAIALQLAVAHPNIVRSAVVHEPVLFGLLAGDQEDEALLDTFVGMLDAVCSRVEAGDRAAAAEMFVDTVVAAGAWQILPASRQDMITRNAATILEDRRHIDALTTIDVDAIAHLPMPVLLSQGDQSPAVFGSVVERLAEIMTDAVQVTIPGAGHVPHLTHPDDFSAIVAEFLDRTVPAQGVS
jgi:pimeloyl-ACP methyl ester carboxylesterase